MQLELLRPLWLRLRLAGRSWCAASSGRLLCGAQGDACRLRECRCPEALAEPLARLAQAPNDPHAVFT